MTGVEAFQRSVSQARNFRWVSAAVVGIDRVGKKSSMQMLPELGQRGTHRTLHLVVNHTVVAEPLRTVVAFQPPPLLRKVKLVQVRKEHRIQIDRQQVFKILLVLGCKRIGSCVAAGESVHVGVQRATQHHEERITHRITFASAERGVLQNMGDTAGVPWQGRECHHESVVLILCREVDMARTRRAMHKFRQVDVKCRHPAGTHNLKTAHKVPPLFSSPLS